MIEESRASGAARRELEKQEGHPVEWIREGWNARRARHAG
jgi:hypothetical protein